MKDHIPKEKAASEIGGLLNNCKLNFNIFPSFSQRDNFRPLSYWLKHVIRNLEDER